MFDLGLDGELRGVLIGLFSERYRMSQKYLKNFVADFQPFVFNFNVILSRLKVALSKD